MKERIVCKGKLVLMSLALSLVVDGASPKAFGESSEQMDAEKLFRAMEKKIAEAKSLKVVYEMESSDGEKAKGSFQVAEGNKARFEVDSTRAGKASKLRIVSDGKQLSWVDSDAAERPPGLTPARFNLKATLMLTRLGALTATAWSNPSAPFPFDNIDIALPVGEIKSAGKEQVGKREAEIVQYTIVVEAFKGEKFHVKLWIDTKTTLPFKIQWVTGANKVEVLTEVYTEFLLDPKLEGKLFELPAAK